MTGAAGPARELFDARDWAGCRAALAAADGDVGLDGPQLLLLGEVAFLTGEDEEAAGAYSRAYRWFLDRGDHRGAARCACLCQFVLSLAGEHARAAGWAGRARRLVAEHAMGGAEEGMLLAEEAHRLVLSGQLVDGLAAAREGERLGLAAGDGDVVVLSRLSIAFAHLLQGERAAVVDLMDEVMVAVSAGETSAAVVGIAYCSAIDACVRVRDVRRAREWTAVLTRWCDDLPDLVPFRGQCLVHRAQAKAWDGDWPGAAVEAARAEELLRGPAAGAAAYQLGEVHRLMGALDDAAHHYRRANGLGRRPEPGLSRLRLAQGRAEDAERTLTRLCAEDGPPEDRAELLDALVDARLAVGDVPGAAEAAGELSRVAAGVDATLVRGLAHRADAAAALAADRPAEALEAARACLAEWAELDLPHPCAQVRLLLGRCLRALGDEPAAQLEFDAARDCLVRLGAEADLAVLAALGADRPAHPGGLTGREVEVVRLVAAGHTNRTLARELGISEKTVARHLSNVYTKLGVSSRAATTAYAYDHGLV